MNVKKLLAITLIAIAVLSCLTMVSAGWFDSNDNTSNSAPAKATVKLGNISDSSYSVDESIVQQAGNRMTINPDGSASPAPGSKVNIAIKYFLTVDVSSLNESDKKALEDEFKSGTHDITLSLDNNQTLSCSAANFTLDGNTLTIQGIYNEYNSISGSYPSDLKIVKCEFEGNKTNYITG